MSPQEIVLNVKMNFKKQCQMQFGVYVEADIDVVIAHMLWNKTEEWIALGPAGNFQVM